MRSDRTPLPAAFRLRPDPALAPLEDGRVLLGGTPTRLVRLTPKGADLVRRWSQGAPVGPGRAAGLLARRLVEAGMMHPLPDGPPADARVTIVVPAHGRARELVRCLTALGTAYPVIVVDDASPDPAPIAGAAVAAGARLIRRDVNGGPAAARNTGARAADTPLVAFVDSDCVPEAGWLGPLLPHFADPAVAAVAPRITSHVTGSGVLARYEAESSALDMGPAASIVRPRSAVSYLPSATLVVRRAALGDGFDERMRVGEDVDFVWRLAAAGWQVRYVPESRVAHQHRTRLRAWLARRHDYGTSAAPLAVRHPAELPALSMSGWSALAWTLTAAGTPAAGLAVTAGTTALLARKFATWTDRPWPLAARMAAGGTIAAGEILGRTVTRTWWPLAFPIGLAVPRLRLPLAAAVLGPAALTFRRQGGSALGPLTWTGLRLLDEMAYGLGVWHGCLRERTLAPLLPRLWWSSRDGLGPDRSSDGDSR
ncbi:mycofactocin system glycosyltransferase [Thermomonospora echinospora]|uniref:Mycofactocin system glycosyltransferase n=1 Tax=Thermomonospora echinospora TaxID=1992 RepID=A0A1H6C373_9ACTN|nr:mycofactocin biosynthesis glycosyltransferase MftF [Thermomonospora echinospora]SEG67147.1 mycofactocin system glycosyltransferase [Thermomonospora echinospora]